MGKVLFNVVWEEGQPSLAGICERYGFQPDDLDSAFGVIELDRDKNLYCISVDEKAAARVRAELGDDTPGLEGPFANPPIEPFGPPDGTA